MTNGGGDVFNHDLNLVDSALRNCFPELVLCTLSLLCIRTSNFDINLTVAGEYLVSHPRPKLRSFRAALCEKIVVVR